MARMVYGLRSHLLTPYSGMCLYVWYEPYVCTACITTRSTQLVVSSRYTLPPALLERRAAGATRGRGNEGRKK